MRGRFITLEGIEGAGKSTLIPSIQAFLESRGIRVEVTREPGGTPVGEAIRRLIMARGMEAETELLLMFAARAEHLQRRILPALEAGTWVVSDRFTEASYAYQGGGRGIPAGRIEALERWVQGDFRPHLTLLLDVPVPLGLARARARGKVNRFEEETAAFFERVRGAYLALARRFPERIKVIDASASLEAVRHEALRALEGLLRL